MKDFPNFTVKITSPKPRDNKGLTMPLMKKLVREMTNNSADDIAAFDGVIKCYEESSFHFSKPKAYFLAEYHVVRFVNRWYFYFANRKCIDCFTDV